MHPTISPFFRRTFSVISSVSLLFSPLTSIAQVAPPAAGSSRANFTTCRNTLRANWTTMVATLVQAHRTRVNAEWARQIEFRVNRNPAGNPEGTRTALNRRTALLTGGLDRFATMVRETGAQDQTRLDSLFRSGNEITEAEGNTWSARRPSFGSVDRVIASMERSLARYASDEDRPVIQRVWNEMRRESQITFEIGLREARTSLIDDLLTCVDDPEAFRVAATATQTPAPSVRTPAAPRPTAPDATPLPLPGGEISSARAARLAQDITTARAAQATEAAELTEATRATAAAQAAQTAGAVSRSGETEAAQAARLARLAQDIVTARTAQATEAAELAQAIRTTAAAEAAQVAELTRLRGETAAARTARLAQDIINARAEQATEAAELAQATRAAATARAAQAAGAAPRSGETPAAQAARLAQLAEETTRTQAAQVAAAAELAQAARETATAQAAARAAGATQPSGETPAAQSRLPAPAGTEPAVGVRPPTAQTPVAPVVAFRLLSADLYTTPDFISACPANFETVLKVRGLGRGIMRVQFTQNGENLNKSVSHDFGADGDNDLVVTQDWKLDRPGTIETNANVSIGESPAVRSNVSFARVDCPDTTPNNSVRESADDKPVATAGETSVATEDHDKIPDTNDLPALSPGERDMDGDGVPDSTDPDLDGDGINNNRDTTPAASDTKDTDGDGVTDNRDADIDGDGVSNERENALGTDPSGNESLSPPEENNAGAPKPDILTTDTPSEQTPSPVEPPLAPLPTAGGAPPTAGGETSLRQTLRITNTTLPPATVGVLYRHALGVVPQYPNLPSGPYAFFSSDMPAGLTLDPTTGVIEGTHGFVQETIFDVQVFGTRIDLPDGAYLPFARISLALTIQAAPTAPEAPIAPVAPDPISSGFITARASIGNMHWAPIVNGTSTITRQRIRCSSSSETSPMYDITREDGTQLFLPLQVTFTSNDLSRNHGVDYEWRNENDELIGLGGSVLVNAGQTVAASPQSYSIPWNVVDSAMVLSGARSTETITLFVLSPERTSIRIPIQFDNSCS